MSHFLRKNFLQRKAGEYVGVLVSSDLFLVSVTLDVWMPIKGTKHELTTKLIA